MSWSFTFQGHFVADLKGLDHQTVLRIIKAIERVQEDPMRSMKRLQGSDVFRLRVGDYRILARIAAQQRIVDFLRVGHRSSVYQDTP